jgi:hypothetical protein
MTTGFQQQQSTYVPMPRAAPRPQHGGAGRPVDAAPSPPTPETRSFR